jgi:hypothetical protein
VTRPIWDAKNPVVPVADDGSLKHYPDTWTEFSWQPWEPLTGALTFEGFERGRSAAYAIFRAQDGRKFPMFLADLEKVLLSEAGLIDGQTDPFATWTVRKRGQNYGIGLAS